MQYKKLSVIIIDNDNYYFYIISTLDNFIKDNYNEYFNRSTMEEGENHV